MPIMTTEDLLAFQLKMFGEKEFSIVTYNDHLYGIEANERNADGSFHYFVVTVLPGPASFVTLTMRAIGGDSYGDRIYASTSHQYYGESTPYYHRDLSSAPGKYKQEIRVAAELIRIHKEANFWPFRNKLTGGIQP